MSIMERLRAGIATPSAEETQAIAAELGAALPRDATVALHGDLGVGKTTFVQGLARGLGINEPVTSPTFNIFTVYRAPPGGRANLVHLDAYRLKSAREIEELLLADFLTRPWCLAVEWPGNIEGWLPPDTLRLELGIAPDQRHTLRLM
jgi:tRNA threonylcarbamoyladenosine biosynthesis protein TsaE